MKTKVEIKEKVDKEIVGVLINLGTLSTILIKKSAQGVVVTSTRKMRKRSQDASEPQIQTPMEEQQQSRKRFSESYGGDAPKFENARKLFSMDIPSPQYKKRINYGRLEKNYIDLKKN